MTIPEGMEAQVIFKDWLATRLAEHHQSTMEVALRLGFLDADLEDWLAGRSVPDLTQCGALATWFGEPAEVCGQLVG